jgi:hypothetical protein
MMPAHFLAFAINPALWLLPPKMTSDNARAMVLAVCWQESRLAVRRQQPTGPARSYAQFELVGVAGVIAHRASRAHAAHVCGLLDIEPDVATIYRAIEFNDVLCAAFARLLLWTLPDALPSRLQVERGWSQYLRAWRPGKPHAASWPESFAVATRVVER